MFLFGRYGSQISSALSRWVVVQHAWQAVPAAKLIRSSRFFMESDETTLAADFSADPQIPILGTQEGQKKQTDPAHSKVSLKEPERDVFHHLSVPKLVSGGPRRTLVAQFP